MTEYIKAKEYLKAQCEKRKDSLVLEMPQNYITDVEQAFIDGYHECEKEHEWHYDGTPDTTHKSCLVYCEKLPHIRIAYWNGQDWVENTIIRFPEVKAWRYADYPKEIE
jgi:hypothetical protein